MQPAIYLDHAATTPVDPRVVGKMMPYLYERFGNPSSVHPQGWSAEAAVEIAGEELAGMLRCDSAELVWTSGATESSNLALRGTALGLAGRGRHLVTLATEHASVLEPLRALARDGWELTIVDVESDGRVDLQRFADALRADTVLASVMWVNNETGVIQNIAGLAKLCRERGVLLHVDAAQALGKIDIDLSQVPLDLMSMSAHKLHGPKGIGALFVREGLQSVIAPQMLGGGQQHGLRSGTLPVHQIVGMAEACRLARRTLDATAENLHWLRDRLWEGLEKLGGVSRNGNPDHSVPNVLNVCFAGVDGPTFLEHLSLRIAVSSGSACASDHVAPSHVLSAMGRSTPQALASIRFSLSRMNTTGDIDAAIEAVSELLNTLRQPAKAADDDEDCPMKRLRRRLRAAAPLTATQAAAP